jgi:hypothetical protein
VATSALELSSEYAPPAGASPTHGEQAEAEPILAAELLAPSVGVGRVSRTVAGIRVYGPRGWFITTTRNLSPTPIVL